MITPPTNTAEAIFFNEEKMTCVSSVAPKMPNTIFTTHSSSFPGKQSFHSTADLAIMDELIASFVAIDKISVLPDGWNGYDAKHFDQYFLQSLKRLIIDLPVAPKVFPTGRQSIQLEFKGEGNDFLELEIHPDFTVSMFSQYNGEEIEKTLKGSDLKKTVNSFYGFR